MRILLVRTDRIGDVALITPAVRELKAQKPDAKISVLVSKYTADILKGNPDIYEIITLKFFPFLLKEIKSRRFDAAVLFFVTFKTALLLLLAKIPLRIGPASKIWSVFLNRRLKQKRSQNLKHEAEYNKDLLSALAVKNTGQPPFIAVNDRAKVKALSLLIQEYGLSRTDKLVIIHPGSLGSAKNWAPQNYAKLAETICDNVRATAVLLTGDKSEKNQIKQIAVWAKNRPLFLKENLSLEDFCALISLSRLVVTNSTGPLHIAASLGIKTVSFYPPISGCAPVRWGPLGKNHIVLVPPNRDCEKCLKHKCPDYDCMDLISVSSAFAAVARQLKIDTAKEEQSVLADGLFSR